MPNFAPLFWPKTSAKAHKICAHFTNAVSFSLSASMMLALELKMMQTLSFQSSNFTGMASLWNVKAASLCALDSSLSLMRKPILLLCCSLALFRRLSRPLAWKIATQITLWPNSQLSEVIQMVKPWTNHGISGAQLECSFTSQQTHAWTFCMLFLTQPASPMHQKRVSRQPLRLSLAV